MINLIVWYGNYFYIIVFGGAVAVAVYVAHIAHTHTSKHDTNTTRQFFFSEPFRWQVKPTIGPKRGTPLQIFFFLGVNIIPLFA